MDWYTPVELRGQRLCLARLQLTDADALLVALGSPKDAAEVLEHLAYAPPADTQAAARIIARALADPDRVPYGQRLTSTGQLVGTTSFYALDPGTGSIGIGHTWIGRPWWRTGINTESKLLMLGHAFDALGAERVVWHTDVRNARSQAAIERLGATREGVLRHHRIRRDGSWRDTVQYSLLRDEWPAVARRLAQDLRRR